MLDFYPTALMAAQDHGLDVIRLRSILFPVFADADEAESALEAAALGWLEARFTVHKIKDGIFIE